MTAAATNFQSTKTIVLSLLIGTGAVLILGIQPLMLGGLLERGTLNAAEIGWVATSEVLATALGVVIGINLLRAQRATAIAAGAGVLMALANLGSMSDSAVQILLARGVAGLAEGVLAAVSVLTISYGNAPGRLNAIYLTLVAVPQFTLAYLLPVTLVPLYGVNTIFWLMAATGLGCAVLALSIKDRLAPAKTENSGRVQLTMPVLLTFAATLTTTAAIGSCWAYAEPMAGESGLNPEQTGIAVAVSIICQLLGGLCVAVIGWRLRFQLVLPLTAIALVASVIPIILGHSGFLLFSVSFGALGFLWSASMPFGTDLIVAADPSRASAQFMYPLTLLGLSIGPFLASFGVGASVVNAFKLAVPLFVAATLFYLIVNQLLSRMRVWATPAQGEAQ